MPGWRTFFGRAELIGVAVMMAMASMVVVAGAAVAQSGDGAETVAQAPDGAPPATPVVTTGPFTIVLGSR